MRQSFIFQSFGVPESVIRLSKNPLPDLGAGMVRVKQFYVPINPSDLIPITGAYAHRITLPCVVGYEGIGQVVDASHEYRHLLGRRVLPLRGEGTWQTLVDCPGQYAVTVPEAIPDLIGARAYINPLAAATMLRLWPARNKTILLTAAGSSCAEYLGRLAIQQGAHRVVGIYRSENRRDRLSECGIDPIAISSEHAIKDVSMDAHLVFDALGGDVGSNILAGMTPGANFVSYGLLSGRPLAIHSACRARYHRFHMRDHLPSAVGNQMQKAFEQVWPLLAISSPENARVFAAEDWQNALAEAAKPGGRKPVLNMSTLC